MVAATPCDESETCDEESQACLTPCEVNPDEDGDGADAIACGGDDCDDSRAEINPGAREVCDPLDVDEDCNADTDGTEDIDDDDEVDYRCEFPDGMGGTTTGIDCDDSTPGYFLGDWAHCGTCGTSCGVRESCVEGACVPARRVFASSTGGTGNFGGVAGGDAFCQNLADAAALGGTWKAYLVDDSAGLERLEHASVPYIRLDGKLVAKNFTDLTDGSIAAPINVSEKRLSLTGIRWVGLGVGRNC
ncbi:MAG TPA: hypothetical protein VFG83_18940, partial [Kofleriaceae bacterium]|nr:hypothetical protein [Kofleriaceae bacterium]